MRSVIVVQNRQYLSTVARRFVGRWVKLSEPPQEDLIDAAAEVISHVTPADKPAGAEDAGEAKAGKDVDESKPTAGCEPKANETKEAATGFCLRCLQKLPGSAEDNSVMRRLSGLANSAFHPFGSIDE